MSKTRELYPLSTKKIIKKTMSTMFVVIIIFLFFSTFLITFLLALASYIGSWVLIGLAFLVFLLGVAFLLTYKYQQWYFDFYYYELGADYIVIKKGPITPREITIPYERIQDVYMDQDLLDRFYGLYDVHLSSATASSGMEAHIDGLEKPAADGLRQELLKMVSERISKNRPPTPA